MPIAPAIETPNAPPLPARPMAPSIPSEPVPHLDPGKDPLRPGPGIEPEPKDWMAKRRSCRTVDCGPTDIRLVVSA